MSARYEGGEALAVLVEEAGQRLFTPLIFMPIGQPDSDLRWSDARSPYGYPTPLLIHSGDEPQRSAFLGRALSAMLDALRQRRVVSLFIRLHPLLPLPQEPLQEFGHLVRHGQTVHMDLSLSDEALLLGMRQSHRRNIHSALRDTDLSFEVDEAWNHADDFFQLYTETMCRVQARDYYFFTQQYFADLRTALGEALHLVLLRQKDRIMLACLVVETAGILQYHLLGRRNDSTDQRLGKLLLAKLAIWGRQRGNRYLHLGGGLGGADDPLFYFKSGFSPLRGDFHTWRVVVDAAAYRALTLERHGEFDAGDEPSQVFFPAYRMPYEHAGAAGKRAPGPAALAAISGKVSPDAASTDRGTEELDDHDPI